MTNTIPRAVAESALRDNLPDAATLLSEGVARRIAATIDHMAFRAEVAENGVLIKCENVDPARFAQEAANLGIRIGLHADDERSAA